MTPSKRKGSNAERELAKLLASHGITEAIRMPLSGAIPDFPGDIRLNGYCAEVKRTERFDLWGAWRQVCAAARGGRTPIVFNRRNNSPWLATVEASHWAGMEAELRELRGDKPATLGGVPREELYRPVDRGDVA